MSEFISLAATKLQKELRALKLPDTGFDSSNGTLRITHGTKSPAIATFTLTESPTENGIDIVYSCNRLAVPPAVFCSFSSDGTMTTAAAEIGQAARAIKAKMETEYAIKSGIASSLANPGPPPQVQPRIKEPSPMEKALAPVVAAFKQGMAAPYGISVASSVYSSNPGMKVYLVRSADPEHAVPFILHGTEEGGNLRVTVTGPGIDGAVDYTCAMHELIAKQVSLGAAAQILAGRLRPGITVTPVEISAGKIKLALMPAGYSNHPPKTAFLLCEKASDGVTLSSPDCGIEIPHDYNDIVTLGYVERAVKPPAAQPETQVKTPARTFRSLVEKFSEEAQSGQKLSTESLAFDEDGRQATLVLAPAQKVTRQDAPEKLTLVFAASVSADALGKEEWRIDVSGLKEKPWKLCTIDSEGAPDRDSGYQQMTVLIATGQKFYGCRYGS